MKKHTLLQWILLASVISVGAILNLHLRELREELTKQHVPKFVITDVDEFNTLCAQLTSQWGTSKYALYLLQPNSPIKTHKELVITTVKGLPFIAPLQSYDELTKFNLNNNKSTYFVGNYDDFIHTIFNVTNTTNIDLNEVTKETTFVMLPIYKHSIIVGEMYILFDDVIPSNINFYTKSAELQQLSALIN